MKTLILSISLSILSSLAMAQMTSETMLDSCFYEAKDLVASVNNNASEILKINIAKIPGEQVNIKLKDNNKVLYKKSLKAYGSAKLSYDMSELPKGHYTLEVVKDKKIVLSYVVKHGEAVEYLAQRK